MSLVEATIRPQTSSFAFMPRLQITKSAQLATVTSCAYLSLKVYTIHLKSQGAHDSKNESKPQTLGPKTKVYFIH